jgi:uncharacterized membrane protein
VTMTEHVTTEAPSQSDRFIRGVTEILGGAFGRHVVRRDRYAAVARAVVAIACFTLMLHWAVKSGCADGNWSHLKQYRHACYTDVVALYDADGLSAGRVPYVDTAIKYPVLTGVFMGLVGLPVRDYAAGTGANAYEWFFNINFFLLGAVAVACVGLLLSMRRRRPWDVAMFAASPALLLSATVNWDLLAVGFAVWALWAWSRRRVVLAGVLIGLGTATKLWPALLLIPLAMLGWRAARHREAAVAAGGAALAWLLVNLPFWWLNQDTWRAFYHENLSRGPDWGSFWYIGAHIWRPGQQYGVQPFIALQQGAHTVALNVLSWLLFGLAVVAIGYLVWLAPRRPRLAQVAFLVVAAFCLTSKVWSQQYVLWLVPLALLARPRWGAFVAWQLAEVCYFWALDAELLGAVGNPIMPETTFVIAAMMRFITLLVVCAFVVGDIRNPDRDVVRRWYPDDPDGGVLDGEPDRWTQAALVDVVRH